MRPRVKAALCVVLTVLVLVGPVSGVQGRSQHDAPAAQQVLRIGITPPYWTLDILDPQTASTFTDLTLDEMLFGGLVQLDYRGVPRLDMATGYTLSPDKRTYTFTLRHGMRFADGTPITAQDVVWSWNHYAANPASSASAYITDIAGAAAVLAGKAKSISGVSAPDAYTVRVTTVQPASYFLSLLATSGFLVLEKANVLAGTKQAPWILHAVGSGMYTLQNFKPGVSLTMVANPYYYGTKPKITKVIGSHLGTSQTQLVAYENNEFDIMFPDAQSMRHFMVPGGPHHDEIQFVDAPGLYGIGVRTTNAPTDDIHVRQALSLAIDRNLLTKVILHDLFLPAHRMLWPNPLIAQLPIKEAGYDPARARQLLAGSKYGADPSKYPPIKFIVPGGAAGSSDGNRLAVAMQQMWQQNLGLNVKIIATQAAYLAPAEMAQLQLASWGNDYEDPQEMFHMVGNGKGGIYASYWVGSAKYAWDDPTFDKLDAQQAGLFDLAQRSRIMAQMDQIWTDSASWIPLYFNRRWAIEKPWVRDWHVVGIDTTPLIQATTWIAAH
jgi:ABC-type oligopeptide transport system substrate-binding subunit